jgi:hypothetical protein
MIILERTFNGDGGDSILLEVSKPEPDEADFRCSFRLIRPDGVREGYAMGVDSLQALLLALQKAHIDLLAYRRDSGRQVQWLEMQDLGLPLPPYVTASDFDALPD